MPGFKKSTHQEDRSLQMECSLASIEAILLSRQGQGEVEVHVETASQDCDLKGLLIKKFTVTTTPSVATESRLRIRSIRSAPNPELDNACPIRRTRRNHHIQVDATDGVMRKVLTTVLEDVPPVAYALLQEGGVVENVQLQTLENKANGSGYIGFSLQKDGASNICGAWVDPEIFLMMAERVRGLIESNLGNREGLVSLHRLLN